jgi:hypothetical protein
MTTIKDLIQETEKKKEKEDLNITWELIEKRNGEKIISSLMNFNPLTRERLEAYKKCQTIAEEREKEEIEFLKNIFDEYNWSCWENSCIRHRLQQLNPAQTKE